MVHRGTWSVNAPARLCALREMTLRELAEARARVAALSANHVRRPNLYSDLPSELAKWMDPLVCAEYAVEHLERDLAHILEMGALWGRLTSSTDDETRVPNFSKQKGFRDVKADCYSVCSTATSVTNPTRKVLLDPNRS